MCSGRIDYHAGQTKEVPWVSTVAKSGTVREIQVGGGCWMSHCVTSQIMASVVESAFKLVVRSIKQAAKAVAKTAETYRVPLKQQQQAQASSPTHPY